MGVSSKHQNLLDTLKKLKWEIFPYDFKEVARVVSTLKPRTQAEISPRALKKPKKKAK